MNIDLNDGVLIEFDSVDEADDFILDLEDAAREPGEGIVSNLINGDGVFTLTIRVAGDG